MTTKYIAYPWPEYQEYMGEEWFREECYYCADKDVYFIPINRVNESENKEIRKDIISNLNRYINCIKDGYDTHSAKNFVVKEIEKQIAWLEKQDKNNKPLYIRFGDIPKNEKSKVYNGEIEIGTEKGVSVYPAFEDLEGNIVLGLSLPITKTTLYTQQHLIEYDDRPCYLVTGDYIGKDTDGQPLINNVSIIEKIDTYRVKEKMQSEQKVRCTALMETGNGGIKALVTRELPINSCDDEQKPADEPKFHTGDWIVSNLKKDVFLIKSINCEYFTLEDTKGNIYSPCLPPTEDDYHLWTIQDAKNGDVLVNGSNIFIFHFINGTRLMGYCHVNTDNGRFYDDIGKNECFCLIDAVINPATKEQRDTLFAKMKEAGYTFDFEKKELKKIEKQGEQEFISSDALIQQRVDILDDIDVKHTSADNVKPKIENEIEIPFGAKDSELQEATYYIPEGFHAEINDDKVVIKKGEKPIVWNEDSERIRKRLINLINEVYNNTSYITFLEHKELLAWLEKLDDNIEL